MENIVGLIPAGGGGTRMYPFSRAVPKELYPILGKAVIEHCIENLKACGINNVYMIVSHQKGALMDYVGDGSFFGVNAAYIYQLSRKGIGHAILQAQNWINTTFAVLLGDSFIEPKSGMRDLIDLHIKEKAVATVLLFEVSDPSGYGIVKFKSLHDGWGEIEKLIEKPTPKQAEEYKIGNKYYAICGAYVFEPRIFDHIKNTKPGAKGEVQITDAIDMARHNETVVGMILKGRYLDIGKWKTVLETEKELFNSSDINKHIEERMVMSDSIKAKELWE